MTSFLLLILGCSSSAPTPVPTSPATAAAPASVSAESARSRPAAARKVALYEPDRVYRPAELEGMTLRELSLRRNTIYALAGQSFVKPWLANYFADQPWYHPGGTADLGELSKVDRENADLIGQTESGFTARELRSRLQPLLEARKAGKLGKDDPIEIRLLSEALGDPVGGPEGDPLSHPRMLDHALQPSQLAELSRRDLRLLRNTVYARRGRVFESDQLRKYFEQKAWYEPDKKYTDARLTDVDRANVATIVAEENLRGGNDPDHGGEPFGGA